MTLLRFPFWVVVVDKSCGAKIGVLRLSSEEEPDLAIWIYPQHRGKGYGTEAFSLAVDYIFRNMNLRKIYACCYCDNRASLRTLEEVGFVRRSVGDQQEENCFTGEPATQLSFVLTVEVNDMIHLVDIDPGNWRLGLKISESQKEYVSDACSMLARAYAYRDYRSRAFVIYEDETPIGMGLYYDLPELECYDLSQLFIDERYQGRGYGKAATQLVLDTLKQDGKYSKAVLCYIEGNDAAKKLYEGFGFAEIDRDEDEIIMELTLS